LNLIHAAAILDLKLRQTKRLWRRYQEEGPQGCSIESGAGVGRKKPKKFAEVLRLVRQKLLGRGGGTIRT